MKWTKEHSRNSVAAKARKRMAEPDWKEKVRTKVLVRRAKAKWRLQVRDLEHGDSLTLLLYKLPWSARFSGSDGRQHSATGLGRFLSTLLTQAA